MMFSCSFYKAMQKPIKVSGSKRLRIETLMAEGSLSKGGQADPLSSVAQALININSEATAPIDSSMPKVCSSNELESGCCGPRTSVCPAEFVLTRRFPKVRHSEIIYSLKDACYSGVMAEISHLTLSNFKGPVSHENFHTLFVDQRFASVFELVEWRLYGLSWYFVSSVIETVAQQLVDRLDFCDEFFIPRVSVDSTRKTVYVLKYGVKSRFVNKATFNSTPGKYKKTIEGHCKVVCQGFFGNCANIIRGISLAMRVLNVMGDKGVDNVDGFPLFDIMRLVLDTLNVARQGCDFLNIANVLVSLYALVAKRSIAIPQGGLDALALSAFSMCLPKEAFELIKRIGIFTSAKILDDASFFARAFVSIIDFVKYVIKLGPESLSNVLVPILDLLPFGEQYTVLAEMEKVVNDVRKDKKHYLSLAFRAKVKSLAEKMSLTSLREWSRRSEAVKVALADFNRIVKTVKSYETTRRVEPVCVVFEGPPGSFKSVMMNQVLQILQQRSTNPMSVYSHTIKAAKDGKDFYDLYNNEDVFSMDDVGQQGVSQFRPLINIVSETKCPLDCSDNDLKCTKFFSSPLIIFTTNNFQNLANFSKDDCISSPEALFRRAVVFDFYSVKRAGMSLSGTINVKTYNEQDHHWQSGVPDLGLPKSSSVAQPRTVYLQWIMRYIDALMDMKTNFSCLNDLTSEEIAAVCQSGDEFEDADDEHPNPFASSSDSYYQLVLRYLEEAASSLSGAFGSTIVFASIVLLAVGALAVACKKLCTARTPSVAVAQGVGELIAEMEKYVVAEPVNTVVSALISRIKFCQFYYQRESEDDDLIKAGLCLPSGHQILVPAHYVSHLKSVSIFADATCRQAVWDNVPVKVAYVSIVDDVAILEVNPHIATPFRNCSSLIGREAAATLLATPVGAVPIHTMLQPNADTYYASARFKNILYGDRSVRYDMSAPGLCGVLLCNQTGVIGMHVAGGADNSFGMSVIWQANTRDDIRARLAQDTKYQLPFEFRPSRDVISGVKLDANYRHHVPLKTTIVPSPLANLLPNGKMPPNFVANGVGTIKDLAKKSMKPVAPVDVHDLAFARQVLRSMMKPFSKITMAEVINGNMDVSGLNRKSSNGFGLLKEKSAYVDFEHSCLTPLGVSEVARVRASIISGDVDHKDIMWTECVKDELRLPHKVDKPRTFRCATLTMQILAKELLGGFIAQIQADKWENGIMIGINPLRDFDKIYSRMKRHAIKMAGDFPNYDGGMLPQLQHTIADCIIEKFVGTADDKIVLSFILHNLPHCLVLVLDELYLVNHSMPSGFLLTALINSLVNRALTAMWYNWYCRDAGRAPSMIEFFQIDDFVYGDDKLLGHSLNLPGFDMRSLALYLDAIGIGFTTSRKEPVVKPSETWEEITFLKRSFVYDSRFGKVVCPLDLVTVESSLSWYDSTKDVEEVMCGKIDACNREAYLHQLEYPRIKKALSEAQKEFPSCLLRTEDELHALVLAADPAYCMQSFNSF